MPQRRPRDISFLIVCASLWACETQGGAEAVQGAEAPVHDSRDGFFYAEGAPPPRACATAADCLGDTIPDVTSPCCNNPRTLEPYSRAYRSWVGEWRRDNCADVRCPPPPSPSLPPDCAFEVRCEASLCEDSCD